MQPISLKQSGQFVVVNIKDPFENVIKINNYYDQVAGFGQILKQFSWSYDNKVWSFWSILDQENLLKLSKDNLLPKDKFYFRFRYTLTTIGSIQISDIGIEVEYDVEDKNKGYIPHGYRLGHTGEVEYGSMRGEILKKCNSRFNPYLVNPAIDFYKDICYEVQNMFGLDVSYFKVSPRKDSGDVIFREWTLFDHQDPICTKIMVPDNEFPDDNINYMLHDMGYEEPFEIHIVKENFEEIFGVGAVPQSRDVIHFSFMPSKLYEIRSVSPHRDFMMQIAYWKVDLMKYRSKSDSYASDDVNEILDDITKDSYEAFGEEFKKEAEKITKPQQYDRLVGSNLRDPIRKYVNKELKIYSQKIENHSTVISETHYDLSTIFNLDKNNIGVEYSISSNFKKSDNFSFTCWFKETNPNFLIPIDLVKIISVENNIVKIQLQKNRQYKEGIKLQIYRQGKLNFFGEIVNNIDNKTYELEVDNNVLEHLDSISSNWKTAPGWYTKRCFEEIFIDGMSEIGSPELTKGWRISLIAGQYIKLNINEDVIYFILENNLQDQWYGLTFNYAATFGQMNCSVWEMNKNISQKTTDLNLVYSDTKNGIISEDKETDKNYIIPGTNLLLTNIRIFNEIIEQEKQSLILNQNIVQDSQKLILADNALNLLKIPYVGNTK